MSVVVFFLGLVMISLPFIPMLMEIVKKSDLSPLQISNQTLKDPRSVPDYVFWYLAHLLKVNGLIELKEKVSVSVSTMVGDSLLAIPAGIMTKLDVAAHTKVARVISAGKIILPDYSNHIQKILSLDSIQTGVENNLNEVHAHHLLTIGKKNKVIWWATAENVILQAEAHLPGKVQARKEIVFENGAQFHLLQGALIKSRINFESGSAENQELIKTPSTHIPHKLTISKNHTILDQVVFDGTLIVIGNLTLG